MAFKCNGCGEKVSSSKMAGLAIGKIAKDILKAKGIPSESGLSKALDKGEFSAGVLTGFGVKCPECGKSNWS